LQFHIHTWFVAADFQLFVFGGLLLILIAKYPRLKTAILTSTYLLTIYVVAKFVSDTDLTSFFVFAPE
jgi:hypothetical protein